MTLRPFINALTKTHARTYTGLIDLEEELAHQLMEQHPAQKGTEATSAISVCMMKRVTLLNECRHMPARNAHH